MKKLLLASTALVGFAGAAAAEISLSGYAEIGINGGSQGYETQFHNDWQVNFNFSGTMDSGVEFGGRVQIEENNSSSSINGTPRTDDENFWVSGAWGKVTLGETDGAFDWALSEIYTGSGISDDHSTHLGAYWYTGLDSTYDNQILRYEYAFGDFSAGFSAEMDDSGVGDTNYAIGGKWSGTVSGIDVGVGVGYQDNSVNSVWGLSGSAAFTNGFSVALGYADLDGMAFHTSNGFTTTPLSDSWWGIGVAYTPASMSALTVAANYGTFDTDLGDVSGWGVVANYDLGGGAVAMASYGSSDNPTAQTGVGSWNGHGDDTWSLGLGLSF